MPEADALKNLAEGGMLARAAERLAGENSDGHTHERCCLNCGCLLTGEFCHCCGQRAHVHRTIGAFFHDLAHGVLHFEGKIWRTLPLLAWRPGELTRRYIDGQRASFVSPVALFLFSVFLMFAVVSATGNLSPEIQSSVKVVAETERAAAAELEKLNRQRAEALATKQPTAEIDEDIEQAQQELVLLRDLRERGVTEASYGTSAQTFSSELPWLEQAYHKAKRDPAFLVYKMKNNSYKWSWAIIPLSVPFLWLMFPFSRRFRTYDHVVFVTYSLSFMTLMISVGTLLAAARVPMVAVILPFIPPIHMYRQLKGAYEPSRFGALWRTVVLVIASIVVLSAFILLMLSLGVMD
jgi:hypothetical protein